VAISFTGARQNRFSSNAANRLVRPVGTILFFQRRPLDLTPSEIDPKTGEGHREDELPDVHPARR
jgi:hypothetical protein